MRFLTNRPRWVRGSVALLIAGFIFIFSTAESCDGPPSAQQQDAARSQQATGDMITNQPVKAGQYSPTRDSINKWVETWESAPGKKAYTYLYMYGQPVGYYVLTGPPVTYAAGATSPYHLECPYQSGCTQMPNPGQDGAFANQGSGGNQFYGHDATSNRQLEWGGDGATYLLSDKPLPIPAPPLGDTK